MQAKEAGYPLDIEWSQKDHAAFFPKYMATKYKWLVTRQKAKKGNPVHLTNRKSKRSKLKAGYKSIKKFFKTKVIWKHKT